MEDDVEVELELEKQLALAHELFPANFRKASYLFRNSKFRILQTNSFMLSYFWPNFDSLIIIKYRYFNYFSCKFSLINYNPLYSVFFYVQTENKNKFFLFFSYLTADLFVE